MMRVKVSLFFLVVFLSNFIVYGQDSDLMIDINEHSTVMLVINPEDGRIQDANDAALVFYGYNRKDLIDKRLSYINLLSDEEIQEEMDRAVSEEREYFTFKHKLADGSIRDVEVYTSPILIDGKISLLSIVHDISDKVLAEKKATRSRVIAMVFVGLFLITINIFLLKVNKMRRFYKELSIQYNALFSNMNDGVAYYEMMLDNEGKPVDYKFLEINEAFERITDFKKEDVVGKSIRQVQPSISESWIETCGDIAREGGLTTIEGYDSKLDKYLNVRVYSNELMRFFVVFNDITEQTLARQAVDKERALLKTTLYSLGDAVVTTDRQGMVEMMNKVASQVTGWTIEEVVGEYFCDVISIIDQKRGKEFVCKVDKVISGKTTIDLTSGYLLVDRNGKQKPVELKATPIIDEHNHVLGMVVVFRDASEKVKILERITFLSYHDQLTKLHNRHFFEEELSRLDRDKYYPLSLLMIDVNGLKLTNDAFGHQKGDELLQAAANILNLVCRSEDIVARIGGDEFVVLLPNTSKKNAEDIMDRIYSKVRYYKINEIILSVSIGLATKISDDTPMSSIFVEAEEDMYRKKLTESQRMRNETIENILHTFYETNPREKVHSDAVSNRVVLMAEAMGLDEEEVKLLQLAGHLYDIGKISISNSLLEKKGPLSLAEYEEVKKHPEIGYHILKSVNRYAEIADYALNHHEYIDGKGYPRGLKGSEIPLLARIISVADAYEAMCMNAPYRSALTQDKAVEELKKYSGSRYDPEIVDLLIDTIE